MLTGYDHAIATSGRPSVQPAGPGGLTDQDDDGPPPPDFSVYDDTEIIRQGNFSGTQRALEKFKWLRRVQ